MACKPSYELHHNFPKLADESGFTFNSHRPKVHIDWNKIRLLDVESLIRDRKFILIENHLNDVLDCVLESEFDVRILDEGVVKMFRLAQLTVEYQQFCRHYLDRSVYVLRDELTSTMQKLEDLKKELRDKEEEIRKLKRKSKQPFRAPMLYGNDNIANMILKTLSNRGDGVVYPSNMISEFGPQYSKCDYCEKIFLNQLYLKSHMARRHAGLMETPEKETKVERQASNGLGENNKLNAVIEELKEKVHEMETKMAAADKSNFDVNTKQDEAESIASPKKQVTEIAISTEPLITNESYLLEKIEEWKKEEHSKYTEELNVLRKQLMETVNSIQGKEQQQANATDNAIIIQLHKTILDQGTEISQLKEQLTKVQSVKHDVDVVTRKNELEAQILTWSKKFDAQNNQYQLLKENLIEVAKQAQEARSLAEAERQRALSLQSQLQAYVTKNESKLQTTKDENPKYKATSPSREEVIVKNKYRQKTTADYNTIEELHRKAQEILNLKTLSSSSTSSIMSDDSNEDKPIPTITKLSSVPRNEENKLRKTKINGNIKELVNAKQSANSKIIKKRKIKKEINVKPNKSKSKTILNFTTTQENGPIAAPRSPIKVLRAKLTERVNNRLVAAGVDPLTNGLTQSKFNKQRSQIQKEQRVKTKKNKNYEIVRNSILTYLDSKAGMEIERISKSENISTTKTPKGFSLTSVISNVKNKALSFVKSSDTLRTDAKNNNVAITQRALTLLQTPPGSSQASPEENRPKTSTEVTRKLPVNIPSRKIIKNDTNQLESSIKNKQQVIVNAKESSEDDSTTGTSDADSEMYDTFPKESKTSIENLIKSPVRRPSTANGNYEIGNKTNKYIEIVNKSYSTTNLTEISPKNSNKAIDEIQLKPSYSEDLTAVLESNMKKLSSEENIQAGPKGVLKNAPSTSSLTKKKVEFDLDAIQMKSVSASPSQSITDKSDTTEKYELGLVNLDDEEWDISSIDNEPLKLHAREEIKTINLTSRTSPKIADLKETIESQLARRNPSQTKLVGGVDVLGGMQGAGGGGGAVPRASSITGSNTSLGSSVFDDDDEIPTTNLKSYIKSKNKIREKDDSEIDLSEFSIEGTKDKKRDSF